MQVLPSLIWNKPQRTEHLSSDGAIDSSGKKLVKGLQAIVGRYAMAVIENVEEQFKRKKLNPGLEGEWQAWENFPHVEWKIDHSDSHKTSSAIRATKGPVKEVFEVDASSKGYGTVRWQSSNPQLGIVKARLDGIMRSVAGTQFSGWQLGSFKELIGKTKDMKTALITDSSLRSQIMKKLMPVVLNIKEVFFDDVTIKTRKISDQCEFRKLSDGFKVVIEGDGELIVRIKDNKLISIQRSSKNGNKVLTIAKAPRAENLNPNDANVIFFKGLTDVKTLASLERFSKAPNTAPEVVEVMLKEAEAIRDLYNANKGTSFSTGVPNGYSLRHSNIDIEPRLKLTEPNGNSLEFSMDNFGHVTSIQKDDNGQTVIVLPANRGSAIGVNSKVHFDGLTVSEIAPVPDDSNDFFKLITRSVATPNTTVQPTTLEKILRLDGDHTNQHPQNGNGKITVHPSTNREIVSSTNSIHPRVLRFRNMVAKSAAIKAARLH